MLLTEIGWLKKKLSEFNAQCQLAKENSVAASDSRFNQMGVYYFSIFPVSLTQANHINKTWLVKLNIDQSHQPWEWHYLGEIHVRYRPLHIYFTYDTFDKMIWWFM